MRSVHPPAPAKTAFVFFKQAAETRRGVQSQAGFLLSPTDFYCLCISHPLGSTGTFPSQPRHGEGGGEGESGKGCNPSRF